MSPRASHASRILCLSHKDFGGRQQFSPISEMATTDRIEHENVAVRNSEDRRCQVGDFAAGDTKTFASCSWIDESLIRIVCVSRAHEEIVQSRKCSQAPRHFDAVGTGEKVSVC